MEDLLKRPVANQQAGLNGAEFGNDSRKPEAPPFSNPPFSNQSEAGTSESSSNLDPASTIAGENSQAPDFGLPSPEGKSESAMHFPDLIVFSVFHCSR
jgi:hypothetical protein